MDHHQHGHDASDESCCGCGSKAAEGAAAATVTDPVCGMKVDPATVEAPLRPRGHDLPFLLAPAAARSSRPTRRNTSPNPRPRPPARAARRHLHLPDAPADPPGRARELPDLRHGARTLEVTAEAGPNHELADMTRRFWIGLALAAPGLRAGDGRPHLRRSACTGWCRRSSRTGSSSCCPRPWCCGPAGRSSSAAGPRWSAATSTCSP